jgi:transcriptional regulator with PAS, ATPase and Fis domain
VLQNIIQRYLAVKTIDFINRNDSHSGDKNETDPGTIAAYGLNLQDNVGSFEKDIIRKALLQYDENKSRAAEAHGKTRKKHARKIKTFKL